MVASVLWPTCLRLLTALAVLLVLGYLGQEFVIAQWGLTWPPSVRRLLDLNGENNLPAWFASSLLLACAALLAAIGLAKRRLHDPYARSWQGLALLFVCLSLDEAASLHELLNTPLRRALQLDGYLFYGWVLPAGAFVVIVLALYGPFLVHLPARTRGRFLVAGALFVTGAIGVELLEARHDSLDLSFSWQLCLLITLEESLEMAGVLVFLRALAEYAVQEMPALVLALRDGADRDEAVAGAALGNVAPASCRVAAPS